MKKIILLVSVILLMSILTLFNTPAQLLAADKYGGTLWIASDKTGSGYFGIPSNLRGQDEMFAYHSLQRLLRPDEKGGIESRLAESWNLVPEKRAYVIKLRKGVKFHDGTDFNAQAVKWNLDRLLKGPRAIPTNSKSTDVVDDHTIQLNFSEWSQLIINDLAVDPSCLFISPTAFEKNGEDKAKANPVGTGAFTFKSYKRGVVAKYEKFDGYWEKGLPYLDGVNIIMIPDQMTRIASLKAGEIHGVLYLDVPSARQLKGDGSFDMFIGPGVNFSIFCNSKDPTSPFSDKRVRQAIEYAIDRETITRGLGSGFTVPINKIIPETPDIPGKLIRSYNPEKAKQLLAEAGYPNGLKIDINAPTFAARDFLGAVQDYLGKVGIEVKLVYNTYPAQQAISIKGGLGSNLSYAKIPALQVTPLYTAKVSLASSSPWQVEMVRTPGFDDLLDKALVELDPKKVTSLLQQMEELAYADAMHIPLWRDSHLGAVQKSVHDYKLWLWYGPAHDFSRTWISK
ncbi:ABC transporter substrate-binding protein [Thermodesulfobacteriota bacterium]